MPALDPEKAVLIPVERKKSSAANKICLYCVWFSLVVAAQLPDLLFETLDVCGSNAAQSFHYNKNEYLILVSQVPFIFKIMLFNSWRFSHV